MTVTDAVVRLAIILGFFLVVPLVVGQMEHKAMAHMQSRVGPMYAGGFHGWAQLVADGVKFAQKEDVVPAAADRRVFQLAPAVALIPYLVVLVDDPDRAGHAGRAEPGRRAVLRAGGDGRRRAGLADGRLGQREQVLAARRHPQRGAADGLRAADDPGRVLGGDGRRHPVADRHRRSLALVLAARGS